MIFNNKYLIYIIIILIFLFPVNGEETPTPPPPKPQSVSSSSGEPIAEFSVSLAADRYNITRGESINFMYNITYWGGSTDPKKYKILTIHVPKDIFIIEKGSLVCSPTKIKINKISDEKIEVHIPGTGKGEAYKENILLSYSADISSNALIGTIRIDPKESKYISYNSGRYHPGEGCLINISNKMPKIISIKIDGDAQYVNSSCYNLFLYENVNIICHGIDEENDMVSWKLSQFNSSNNLDLPSSAKTITNSRNATFTYKASSPGTNVIEIHLIDNDGDYDVSRVILYVADQSKSQYVSEIYSIYSIKILIVYLMFLFIRRLFRFKAIPIISVIIFLIFWLVGLIRSVPTYELSLYVVMLTFAAYFIEANFEPHQYSWKSELNEILNKKDLILVRDDSGKLNIHSNLVPLFRSVKSSVFYPDIILWVVSATGMSIITLIIFRILPESELFRNGPSPQLYDYTTTYYTVNINAFSVILAIIVTFAMWYLQSSKDTIIKIVKNPTIYKDVVIRFIFLYIILILLSFLGLIIGTIPMLDVTKDIGSISVALSIMAFECTLLLIIPAFVCLYEFVCWIMSIHEK